MTFARPLSFTGVASAPQLTSDGTVGKFSSVDIHIERARHSAQKVLCEFACIGAALVAAFVCGSQRENRWAIAARHAGMNMGCGDRTDILDFIQIPADLPKLVRNRNLGLARPVRITAPDFGGACEVGVEGIGGFLREPLSGWLATAAIGSCSGLHPWRANRLIPVLFAKTLCGGGDHSHSIVPGGFDV